MSCPYRNTSQDSQAMASIILDGRNVKAFPIIFGIKHECPLPLLMFNTTLDNYLEPFKKKRKPEGYTFKRMDSS